jgi:hypothetical protein
VRIKNENEKTQAPPTSGGKRKALLLSGAHTAVTGANESKKHRKPVFLIQKAFPSKSAAKSRFRTRKIVGLPIHMMP